MTPAAWASVAAICALGAASPGPSLALVVRHSLSGSRALGVACALAHAMGVGVHALLTAAGLAAVLVAHPGLYRLLAVAGALYLAWLAWGILRQPGAHTPSAGPGGAGIGAAMRDGFLMALLNPKIAVFFLALFSQFVSPDSDAFDMAVLWATATAIDGAWYSLVAVGLTGSRWLDGLRSHGAVVERVTGVLLLGLAAWTLGQAALGGG